MHRKFELLDEFRRRKCKQQNPSRCTTCFLTLRFRTLTSLPDSWVTSLCVKLQRLFDSSAALQLIYAIRSERETARQFSIEPSGDFDFIGSAHVSDRVFDLCDVHNSLTLPFQAMDSIASPSEAYFPMRNPSFEAKKSSPWRTTSPSGPKYP
jgi:hypothetical protein